VTENAYSKIKLNHYQWLTSNQSATLSYHTNLPNPTSLNQLTLWSQSRCPLYLAFSGYLVFLIITLHTN